MTLPFEPLSDLHPADQGAGLMPGSKPSPPLPIHDSSRPRFDGFALGQLRGLRVLSPSRAALFLSTEQSKSRSVAVAAAPVRPSTA